MAWFRRTKANIVTSPSEQNDVPDGQWIKDPETGSILNRRELHENFWVAPGSGHHFRLRSEGYSATGKWSLSQICEHLTATMRMGLAVSSSWVLRICSRVSSPTDSLRPVVGRP